MQAAPQAGRPSPGRGGTLPHRMRPLVPEQIDGRLKHGRCVVSFATIYRAVNAGGMDAPQATGDERVRRHLRRKGRRSKRGREEARGKIKISHDISERPVEANGRSRLGDWEDDTVVGPGTAS